MNSKERASVFVVEIVPRSDAEEATLTARLRALPASFSLERRPRLDPSLFEHRLLRREGGAAYAWEITFLGTDTPDDEGEPAEGSLAEAILMEVRARVASLGEVGREAAYEDISALPAAEIADAPLDGITSFAEGEPLRWEDYAPDAKTDTAGHELPDDLTAAIERARALIPPEPDLKPYREGHIYFGNSDKAHIAYVKQYLAEKAASLGPADRRKVLAFAAFQGREGSTTAINTYDNQIVTWGTGWGGFGAMGQVVQRATRTPAVRDLFTRSGLRYRGQNAYDVVDLTAKKVVTGKREALLAMRAARPLIYMLIYAARDASTRQAVTDAQLQTFMAGSGDISSADQIATQGLFNFIAHLRHWAPAFATGCVEWAVRQIGAGSPSEERDKKLAVQVGRFFYGNARKTKWLPDWKQFQMYWEHMKKDGLDCMDDPFIKAPAAPADDPFASSPAASPADTPKATNTPAEEPLKNQPLAAEPELAAVARGERALKRGSKGAGVVALQKALIMLGFEVRGGADGDFGGGTDAAVKAFQEKHALGADGAVGRATIRAVDAALGERAATKAS